MKNKFFISVCMFSLIFLSCVSSDEEIPEDVTPPVIEEQILEEPESIIIEETVQEKEEEIPQKENQDDFEEVVEISAEDEEYLRSINDIEDDENEIVTKDEFTEDKAAILKIIAELSDSMENFNFEKWKSYIDPESIEYYSNTAHLRKAQKMLPDKTIHLKGLKDYFRYVFIPSRKVSKVDEIRYISKKYVKAVEVRDDDNTTIVYYYFIKRGNKWFVNIPKL